MSKINFLCKIKIDLLNLSKKRQQCNNNRMLKMFKNKHLNDYSYLHEKNLFKILVNK